MATIRNRRPLAIRPLPLQNASVFSPFKTTMRTVSGSKRSRSPDVPGDSNLSHPTSKRLKAVAPSPVVSMTRDPTKERRHAEREQQKAEFKDKYTRAFPSWTFYFDLDNIEQDTTALRGFEARIQQLGGEIEDFFSNEITHLITHQPILTGDTLANKENIPKSKSANMLKSPVKFKGRLGEEAGRAAGFDLVAKAITFGIKIWNTAKLESVLSRLIDLPPSASTYTVSKNTLLLRTSINANPQRSLSRLLQSERIHGTTERDPTQKRHDFRYFSRGSRFVLIEDMRQELATIAAHEYIVPKGREGTKSPWPVLHCHPHARGPFLEFDEREKRRWEKQQQTDMEREDERKRRRNKIIQAEVMKRRAEAQLHAKKTGDLRRSVSMSNLHRRAGFSISGPRDGYLVDLDCDGDNQDSANASGFLASGTGGYMAASGNSVGITSTTGATSTAGHPLRSVQLPSALSGRIKQQVVTSRKFTSAAGKQDRLMRPNVMGPPAGIPERQPMLRKSRSTNTLKLPKREEGIKPGYCESCRVKFEDFKTHILSRKHGRFASNDANFLQLDCVLDRVKRRTLQEVQEELSKREERRKFYCRKAENRGEASHCEEGFISKSCGCEPIQREAVQDDTEMGDGES